MCIAGHQKSQAQNVTSLTIGLTQNFVLRAATKSLAQSHIYLCIQGITASMRDAELVLLKRSNKLQPRQKSQTEFEQI